MAAWKVSKSLASSHSLNNFADAMLHRPPKLAKNTKLKAAITSTSPEARTNL